MSGEWIDFISVFIRKSIPEGRAFGDALSSYFSVMITRR